MGREKQKSQMDKGNKKQNTKISIQQEIKEAVDWVSGWIYPRRCPVCRQIVVPRSALVHSECRKKLCEIHPPACMKCGCQMESLEQEYCARCEKHPKSYDRGYAVWEYNAEIRRSLADFKYYSRKEFADFYTAEAVRLYGERVLREAPDVFVPVPVHPSRRRQRGFNQAELLAKKIGEKLKIPVDGKCLIRVKKTVPLKELGAKARAVALKDAFWVRGNVKLPYRHVMLVDDIYTTGGTINECTKALRMAGVERVTFLCMAIGTPAIQKQTENKNVDNFFK